MPGKSVALTVKMTFCYQIAAAESYSHQSQIKQDTSELSLSV